MRDARYVHLISWTLQSGSEQLVLQIYVIIDLVKSGCWFGSYNEQGTIVHLHFPPMGGRFLSNRI